MKKISGYADRWSVASGEKIGFMVSSMGDAPFDVEISRVICADPNPSGPGYREVPVTAACNGRHAGRFYDIALGSHAGVDVDLGQYSRVRIRVTVWLSSIGRDEGVLWSLVGGGNDLVVGYGPHGIEARLTTAQETVRSRTEWPLHPRRWYDVEVAVDFAGGGLQLMQRPHAPIPGEGEVVVACSAPPFAFGEGRFLLGGALRDGHVRGLLNGKLEGPSIYASTPTDAESLVAGWNFCLGIPGSSIVDVGPNHWHGELLNLPTRAVRGSNWTGRHLHWPDAPTEYGAIHFHKDDVGDVGWPKAFELAIPDEWASGLYVARLRHPHGSDEIPFVVRPGPERSGARVAVLLSTFTYQVYGQWIRPGRGEEIAAIAEAWGALPDTPDQHPEYGLSPYNFHEDDGSVVMASFRRPMIDKRIRQVSYVDPSPGGSGTFWLTADTYILAWLTDLAVDHDVVTDHDLHDGSIDLASRYDVVVTSHHPEYQSQNSLDAIGRFLDAGGRLMYLGGNGFYWKVAIPEEMPWAIELRRDHGGVAVSATEPGEGCHASDGTPGGLWRRLGAPPQERFGVGFTCQGYYRGYPYRLTDAILDKRLSFLGAESDPDLAPGASFGDFGLMGGGAAGLELDRADPLLGTPPHTLIIASATVTDPRFFAANEEYTTTARPFNETEYMRADITFFETPSGGAVFSVGSMTYIGALAVDRFRNPVAKLTGRMLRRMLDERPF